MWVMGWGGSLCSEGFCALRGFKEEGGLLGVRGHIVELCVALCAPL